MIWMQLTYNLIGEKENDRTAQTDSLQHNYKINMRNNILKRKEIEREYKEIWGGLI
jgi:hypothetical protein